MELDIEKYVESLLPWDFSVKVAGVVYATRPLTLGDILLIEQINREGTRDTSKLVEFVASLFVGENRPDVLRWPIETFLALIAQLMGYWRDRSKKNAERMAASLAPNDADGGEGKPAQTTTT